jgi:hypothetical protein
MLRGSAFYSIFLAAQIVFYAAALLGLQFDNPITRRISGPAAAFCLLNAAAVAALWNFLFSPGPLWKIWGKPQLAYFGTPPVVEPMAPLTTEADK